MKTLRITDDAHQKLTALLGELTAQTSRMQTYTDAVETLLKQTVVLPPEVLTQIENFIRTNKHLGYTTIEEFIRDAARWRLKILSGSYEYVELPKEKFEKAEWAVKEMGLPFFGVSDFLDKQLDDLLEKYGEWQQQKEEHEKRLNKKK